jgi:predicted AlkP superfamily pyrophosphatase or phosphodiesterase
MHSLRTRCAISSILALASLSSGCALPGPTDSREEIALVLQITVDGLRKDLLDRSIRQFGEGGFRLLLDFGTVYENAHYQHANTETIVGHATLATGATPADHGLIGNVWYDGAAGELAYNIEDAHHPLLPSRDQIKAGEQVDPAQQLARTQGRSPRALLSETFSDRLAARFEGEPRIFAVSGKDRGAVPMAGQTGKAFWFSTDTGDFVTSRYYYEAYPSWVADWNARRQAEAWAGRDWALLGEPSTYLLIERDDRSYETDLRGFGRVFPHRFAEAGSPLLPTQVLVSPVGDQLTADFAKALIDAEQLGQDSTPDYLAISFSGVDAINHFFGPSSLENEDVLRQLDRTLADLFAFVDETVGLERTLIVLSGDHGMPEMPEAMEELGFPAGRLYSDDVALAANQAGEDRLGITEVVRFYFRPWLYLDETKIEAAGLISTEVRSVIASAVGEEPGIALAVSRDELDAPQPDAALQRIQRNFHAERSGDIYVAHAPYWFHFDKGPIAAMHGSPWRYDTHVPIVFAGPGIEHRVVHRLVHPQDVAPTLSALVGATSPASASGAILTEVLEGRHR